VLRIEGTSKLLSRIEPPSLMSRDAGVEGQTW